MFRISHCFGNMNWPRSKPQGSLSVTEAPCNSLPTSSTLVILRGSHGRGCSSDMIFPSSWNNDQVSVQPGLKVWGPWTRTITSYAHSASSNLKEVQPHQRTRNSIKGMYARRPLEHPNSQLLSIRISNPSHARLITHIYNIITRARMKPQKWK